MKIEKKINGKKNIWNHIRTALAIVAIVISFATVASATNGVKFPNSTPLQDAIKQDIANGNFSLADIEGNPEYSIKILEKNESHIKLKSKTVIKFKNPRGAGYSNNKWPKFEVKDDPELRKNGKIRPGDYDQVVKDYIASSIQNITNERERTEKLAEWKKYDFESGPRTEIIEETYEVTYPEDSQSLGLPSSTSNGVLMGFTKNPHVSWIVEDRKTFFGFEIYYYKAGFELDTAYGLRLPTEAGLNTPALMIDKQNYILSTYINGADWDGFKYSNANVLPENGNEFVARFRYFLGVVVRITYITVIDWHIEANRDYGRSFKTPIGSSESFPNLDLYLDPTQTGLKFGWSIAYLGIGMSINPDLSPDKITTDWSSTGDSFGNGLLGYYAPSMNYNFGPVSTGDYSPTTDYANVRLNNFKYYFDQCRFEADAFVRLHLGWTGFSRDWDFPLNLYALDCSGSYLGTHLDTNANNVNEYILVDRITVVSPNGGESWIRGNTNIISWKPGNNAGPYVKIELLKGGTFNKLISSSTPNDGSYSWTVPTAQTLGNDYKIKITSISNSLYWDTSNNNFIITTPVNLLKNPGFEIPYGSVPMYWNKYQTGYKAVFTYPEVGRTGTGKSVSIKYTTKEAGKVAIWRQTGIGVVPSKQYKLSGYMKLSGVSGGYGGGGRSGGASIRVTWVRSDGGIIKTDVINKVGTIGWTKYEKIVTSPWNAARATVGGDLFDSSGKVWFDDMSLVRVS